MDRIRYRPQNVRETLVELKNTSELAVDLAYAAALYGNEGLAEAVLELEAQADSLQYPAKMSLMLAAKRASDAERLVGIVQIVEAAVSMTNAAADVASIVHDDIGLPDELRAALPEAGEVVVRATVADGSDLAGRSLAELSLETETGVAVMALRRDGEWLPGPDDDTVLRAGDVLIGSGPWEGVETVYERATGERRPEPTGGRTDVPELQQAARTVVELKDIAELAIGLAYGAVLFDDDDLAADVHELEQRSDALQNDIESWVIEAGGVVADPSQLHGLLHLAAASEAICDAALDVADIVLRDGEIHPVFGQAIRESDELIATATVADGSDLAGSSLGAVALEERTGMSVMAIRRRGDWLLAPAGDTELRPGDALVARGPEEGVEKLRELAGTR